MAAFHVNDIIRKADRQRIYQLWSFNRKKSV